MSFKKMTSITMFQMWVKFGSRSNGGFDELRTSLKALGGRLNVQEGEYKLLFEKASHLELVSKKSQSLTVSSAIKELLKEVRKILGCRGEVTSAFNVSWKCVLALASQDPEALNPGSPIVHTTRRTQTDEN
ncbi:hypothetical protein QTP88_018277 [Uroleucon formosanum]